MTGWPQAISATLIAALCAGCALTSKSDSISFRYFTPEAAPAGGPAPVAPASDLQLRLGKVNAASYIKDRIAFRQSEYEIGFYDGIRWTEKPESYVRRALARALFEEKGIHQVISGNGLVLEVELEAFEEMRAPRHAGYVRLTWMLHGPQMVVASRTLTVEHPLSSSTAEAVAGSLADALHEAIRTMVSEVVTAASKNAALEAEEAKKESATPAASGVSGP